MAEDYIDKNTGWQVSRKPFDEKYDIVTLTDPATGEKHEIHVEKGSGPLDVEEFLIETEGMRGPQGSIH